MDQNDRNIAELALMIWEHALDSVHARNPSFYDFLRDGEGAGHARLNALDYAEALNAAVERSYDELGFDGSTDWELVPALMNRVMDHRLSASEISPDLAFCLVRDTVNDLKEEG